MSGLALREHTGGIGGSRPRGDLAQVVRWACGDVAQMALPTGRIGLEGRAPLGLGGTGRDRARPGGALTTPDRERTSDAGASP